MMKPSVRLLALALTLAPLALFAAQTAQARLYCLSIRFQRGPGQTGEYALDFTTMERYANGELAPDFAGSFTHSGFLVLRDEFFGQNLGGMVVLDVPDSGDANANGFPDFFEVAQPVSGASEGRYNLDVFGIGVIEASWSRAAGSAYGTCVLKFKPSPSAVFDTFTHTFELLEYAGPLSYTPGAGTVSGSVNLVKSGDSASLLLGPIQFQKIPTNAFNLLSLESGAWTNQYSQSLTYTNRTFERDLAHPTNYFGYVLFDEGEPATTDPDFFVWVLSIDDTHDINRNGIPDLSDDAGTPPPRPPVLSLARSATNLLLAIRGEAGRAYQVEGAGALGEARWEPAATITLTNELQAVELPLPAEGRRFWRVRVR